MILNGHHQIRIQLFNITFFSGTWDLTVFYNYSYLTFFHWVFCQVYFVRFMADLEQDCEAHASTSQSV